MPSGRLGDPDGVHQFPSDITAFAEDLCHQLYESELVSVPTFGDFVVRKKRDQPGRNPMTSEPITIPGAKFISFLTDDELLRRIAKGHGVDDRLTQRLIEENGSWADFLGIEQRYSQTKHNLLRTNIRFESDRLL